MLFIIMLFIIFWFLLCAVKLKYYLHMMQIEGYKSSKYLEWINYHKDKVFTVNDKIYIIISILITIVFLLSPIGIKQYTVIFASIFTLATVFTIIKSNITKYESKKPLVFTPRAKRLYIISLCLIVLDLVITLVLVYFPTKNLKLYFPVWANIIALMYYGCAYYMLLGNYIAKPIEEKINRKYYNEARMKINEFKNLTSVGITGSYGKTSTKFITSTILQEKFKVLNTPDSFNTPMGISKVINNDLTEDYNIFIAELGATKIGDIEEVALLTSPKIGLITSIGPCHLETFKSIDNIMRTKYELIEKLPDDGIAIFNYDNEHVKKLADKTFKEKILYGVDNIEDTDVFAINIKVDKTGSSFTLCINDLGSVQCRTKLLGKHNILNILAGASIAKVLGLTLKEISIGISKIDSVEHRLQLIDPGTGVIVIDDAFNSNPDGAKAALEVLDSFTDYRKIIVTPGMIELGELEEKENEKFGENIAKVCDVAILVGKKRTLPIFKGLQKFNFNDKDLYVVNSLDEASEILKTMTKVNDVVLFENDLPDTYNEK